jgi:hypothetical protein
MTPVPLLKHAVRRAGWALSLTLAVGCGPVQLDDGSAGELDPFSGELLYAAAANIDVHTLMSDADMTGGAWVTAAQVQAFLNKKGGLLKTYRDPAFGNRTAADLIVSNARAQNISPIYILARIQTESSLISSGSSSNIPKATGCGCPDGSGCADRYRGFGKQVECAAQKMRGYLSDLTTKGTTIAGWRVNVNKNTLDPCTIKPTNQATAALYTYTPWVGAYGRQCGRRDVGGSSLLAAIYNTYEADATMAK